MECFSEIPQPALALPWCYLHGSAVLQLCALCAGEEESRASHGALALWVLVLSAGGLSPSGCCLSSNLLGLHLGAEAGRDTQN